MGPALAFAHQNHEAWWVLAWEGHLVFASQRKAVSMTAWIQGFRLACLGQERSDRFPHYSKPSPGVGWYHSHVNKVNK